MKKKLRNIQKQRPQHLALARDGDKAGLREREEEKGERMEAGGVVGGWGRRKDKAGWTCGGTYIQVKGAKK
jgi:hypothetical protein